MNTQKITLVLTQREHKALLVAAANFYWEDQDMAAQEAAALKRAIRKLQDAADDVFRVRPPRIGQDAKCD